MEPTLIIKGGNPLKGTVTVSGAKNAAVAILPAALLSDEPCVVDNLPDILDVKVLSHILQRMGAKAEFKHNIMAIDPRGVENQAVPYDLTRHMRASYYLLGAMLGRFGEATIALPGGCVIGSRPIDQHLKGMEALGADIKLEHGSIVAKAPQGLKGAEIYMDVVSVGATANIMMAAVKAQGKTIIVNAAKEPHIVDLGNFLNSMGANIKGAGTDVVRITGVPRLHGCSYTVIPDQIETGTLMIAAAATGGDVWIQNVIPMHMDSISAKLMEMGVYVEEGEDSIRVSMQKRPRHCAVRTHPYPGFPTDLQQPLSALLCIAEGTSTVEENIFEDRFKHLNQLQRMGADVSVSGRTAIFQGVEALSGADVVASDLRAGACLVIAGLMAGGETRITGLKHIDRGYDHLEDKLRCLGAEIRRVDL